MTDLATLDLAKSADTPFEFELKHPESHEGLGIYVSVIGSESETFNTYMREKANAARLKGFEQQRRGKAETPPTIEEEEGMVVDAIATCMTGWRTVKDGKSEATITCDGKALEFSKGNAVEVLRRFRWIRAQVNEATADLGNFIKA